jgi:hypothetical protein
MSPLEVAATLGRELERSCHAIVMFSSLLRSLTPEAKRVATFHEPPHLVRGNAMSRISVLNPACRALYVCC